MDETTAEDEVRELRVQLRDLRERVHRVEKGLFRGVAALGVAAMVLGFFVPFLAATEPSDDDSVALLPTIFGIGGAGDGPFAEEAIMAAVVVGVFGLAILVALFALLRLFGDPVGSGPVKLARICGTVLLVGCALAWLLVFALVGHSEGEVSAFSPATLCFTIGGGAMLAAAPLHPADWRG
ncbi:hypothetical protein [Actinophytocola sp. KF-1]